MTKRNIVVAGGKALEVANDLEPQSRYRTDPQWVPLDLQTAPAVSPADTLIFVDEGTLEVMVNGASFYLGAGQLLRVPAGKTYAFRNAGRGAAKILSLPMFEGSPALSAASVIMETAA